jgi:hypothetical protein
LTRYHGTYLPFPEELAATSAIPIDTSLSQRCRALIEVKLVTGMRASDTLAIDKARFWAASSRKMPKDKR